MKSVKIRLYVNGQEVEAYAPAEISLADLLHEKLGLTGTKVSCGIGVCKACTVAVTAPGAKGLERVQACIMPASGLEGYNILTVEGLASGNALSPQQQAVLKNFSFQCGYCAPGFLMGITLLVDRLQRNPVQKSELERIVMDSMGDHICRCSGYAKYYQAIYELLLNSKGLVV